MAIYGIVCAHPSRSLLEPFIPWVRRRAKFFYSKTSPTPFLVSNDLSKAMTDGSMLFARETSAYLLSTGQGASPVGTFGWGITKMRDVYDAIPKSVQREIVPDEQKWAVNAVLSPDTARLLKTFELDKWATSIQEANQTFLISFKAINCLWIQILILDVAIQFFIHGHWGFEPMDNSKEDAEFAKAMKFIKQSRKHDTEEKFRLYNPFYCESWGQKEAAVVGGIVRAWRLPNLSETPEDIVIDAGDKDDPAEEILDWQKLNIRLRDWDLA
jgi:hypothetical protein